MFDIGLWHTERQTTSQNTEFVLLKIVFKFLILINYLSIREIAAKNNAFTIGKNYIRKRRKIERIEKSIR